jgi:hypothetical protein
VRSKETGLREQSDMQFWAWSVSAGPKVQEEEIRD